MKVDWATDFKEDCVHDGSRATTREGRPGKSSTWPESKIT